MKIGGLELNVIHTGDARELSCGIPDESVGLIFTDPIYDRRDDYLWLAETARRILKPQGALLCWSNGKWAYENTKWLDVAGLQHRWTFGNVMVGGNQPMNGKIIAKTNRVIWMDFGGESKMRDYLADGLITTHDPKAAKFRWNKSPIFTAQAIKAFSDEGSIIFDPFTGGATVPAICKMLGRNFLACEIEPETAQQARERLNQTMPLLEVQLQEQLFKAEGAAA